MPLVAASFSLGRQAVDDAASAEPALHIGAARWLRDEGPRYWAELLGLGEGFVETLERTLAQRQARTGAHPTRV